MNRTKLNVTKFTEENKIMVNGRILRCCVYCLALFYHVDISMILFFKCLLISCYLLSDHRIKNRK